MRLGGRLAASIAVLDDIERRHRPAAEALRDWGLSHRFAGSGDRAAIGNIVYDALRRRRSAGWLLDSETPRALAFGALLLEWAETPESLNGRLAGDAFAPSALTAPELARLAAAGLDQAPEAVQADCPEWCAPLLRGAFGADWVGEGRGLAARPPLDLRVNTLKAERARVLAALASTGAEPTDLAPQGVRIAPIAGDGRHPNVQAEAAFRKGWFEVQDQGSQLVAALIAPDQPCQVLDFCAGAGGKTLALSAAMGNRGQIFAFDSDKARLAPIFERLKRAGARNVQVAAGPAALTPLQGEMDLVLVDAPCTGSGTWRRRPDAKWRLTERQLEVRLGEQAAILDAAAAFVKPGGRRAYITCSLFAAENCGQVGAFRARHPGFQPLDHGAVWDRHFAAHRARARIDSADGIVLSPARTATDGFYLGLLERRH